MNLHLFLLCGASASVLGLVSCNMFDGGSGGTQLKEPTVDEMAALEKQWGVPSYTTNPRRIMAPPGGDPGQLQPQPQPGVQAAPDPAQLPERSPSPLVQQPAPQLPPEPAPKPAVTPAQIQKLKN